jgi:LuxR family maltose regulon positive regulatory protein
VRPIPALRARVLVAQGRVGEAFAWAREHGLSAEDDLSYLREFEHITLARVLLAQYQAQRSEPPIHDAARLLQRLLQVAEAGQRTGSVIEILVLQALTHHARGDVPGALAALERALTLAEPEGYVRMFAGEGPPMASLLRRIAKQRTTWDYIRRLLNACSHAGRTTPVGQTTPARQRLVEPLSERELDVLRLLGSDLDGPDIARELTVSLNTLRTHTKNIYAQARRQQPPGRRASSRRAQPAVAHPRPLTPGMPLEAPPAPHSAAWRPHPTLGMPPSPRQPVEMSNNPGCPWALQRHRVA